MTLGLKGLTACWMSAHIISSHISMGVAEFFGALFVRYEGP